MKKTSAAMFILTLCAATVTAIFFAGCESTEAGGVEVTPTYVELRKGQSATFHATGAQFFTWTLSNTQIGYLSAARGETVVYTARGGETGVFQEIRVSSSANPTTGSNNVVSASSAIATVKHL